MTVSIPAGRSTGCLLAPSPRWSGSLGSGGVSALSLACGPQGSHLAPSTATRPLTALTHTAAPGRIQEEARSAGTQVAAPRVHALRVLAQAQSQALVDICGSRDMARCPLHPPHSRWRGGTQAKLCCDSPSRRAATRELFTQCDPSRWASISHL